MGLSNTVYYIFQALGILSAVLFGIWYRKKYGLSVKKALAILTGIFAMVYLWTFAHFWIESGFTGLGTKSILRALPYLPLMARLPAKYTKQSRQEICDFMAPLVTLSTGISLFGCVFAGCCSGYPCSWGIYDVDHRGLAFPVQILEAVTLLGIFAFLLWWNRSHHYDGQGTTYPMMLILFGSTRFLWEFARDNEKIWIGCSGLSFHALFMVVVGCDMLLSIAEKRKKKENTFAKNKKNARRKK